MKCLTYHKTYALFKLNARILMYKKGGSYLLELLDYYAAGWPYLFIGLSEFVIISHIYGIQVYYKHILAPNVCVCNMFLIMKCSRNFFVKLTLNAVNQQHYVSSLLTNGTYKRCLIRLSSVIFFNSLTLFRTTWTTLSIS